MLPGPPSRRVSKTSLGGDIERQQFITLHKPANVSACSHPAVVVVRGIGHHFPSVLGIKGKDAGPLTGKLVPVPRRMVSIATCTTSPGVTSAPLSVERLIRVCRERSHTPLESLQALWYTQLPALEAGSPVSCLYWVLSAQRQRVGPAAIVHGSTDVLYRVGHCKYGPQTFRFFSRLLSAACAAHASRCSCVFSLPRPRPFVSDGSTPTSHVQCNTAVRSKESVRRTEYISSQQRSSSETYLFPAQEGLKDRTMIARAPRAEKG